jgi:hypothetical protein
MRASCAWTPPWTTPECVAELVACVYLQAPFGSFKTHNCRSTQETRPAIEAIVRRLQVACRYDCE